MSIDMALACLNVGSSVIGAQSRDRHTELVGWLEVLQDLSPVALVASASAMALVHDRDGEVPHVLQEVVRSLLRSLAGL